jgi:hypothetical protein
MEVTQTTQIQIQIEGSNVNLLLIALSKIYTRLNAIGFDRLGLTKDERYIFNEFFEQTALNNQNNETDTTG